jgi:thymidylate synthase ThyX
MTKQADVFCLTGQNGELLPPAVQATILAKYSRSPQSARDLIAQLSPDEADKFQEKWVVNYGHASVAELAAIPICFEGVSIVASKYLESWQRPGYSEKSTRYQEFSADSFITPPGAPATMKQFARRFYDVYDKLGDRVRRRCAILMNKDPDDPETLKDRTVKARAFDNLRYLLPAGTGTNVAVEAFLRDIRSMVCGLRGHPNPEFKVLGDKLFDAASSICPTLLKHTEPDNFQLLIKSLGPVSDNFDFQRPSWLVEMKHDCMSGSGQDEQNEFKSKVANFYGMTWEAFCKFMEARPEYAEVPDIFKTIKITFDLTMDFGAFRDLQRHRRCEQFVEPLTTNYGYLVPDDIADSELELEYRDAMEWISLYEDTQVIHDVHLMQYMIPLGYLHRSRFQMDLKELYYIAELRTKPAGHISYRRISYEMYSLAKARCPELMQWARVIQPTQIGIHR